MAQYQIFRLNKVKRQGIGGLQAEHNRTKEDVGKFTDSEIDYAKTEQNIYFKKSNNFWEDTKKILKKAGIEKWRKDAVMMTDAIYTASPEALKNMTDSEKESYFLDCLKWHQENLGYVINAVIHVDETSWHMHVNSVPLVRDENGSYRLSAKEVHGNRKKYSERQTDLYEKVSKYYNLERGTIREPSELRKHKTKLQHDIEVLVEDNTNLKAEIDEFINQSVPLVEKVINRITEALKGLNEALKPKIEERINKPKEKALNAQNRALKLMNKEIVFGSTKQTIQEMRTINREIKEAAEELDEILEEDDYER